MRSRNYIFAILVVSIALSALPASAQATRTWVSGVGDDANPCSRTAPCKTFAGAISKTAEQGEINVLDPGGFGVVTITKAITISSDGAEAGVLGAGTNGIVISAGVDDHVVLRGLDIEGVNTGINGVQFLSGGSLTVENCVIHGFTQNGINFAPSGTSKLLVTNSTISKNNLSGAAYAGIFVVPGVSGVATATIQNVQLFGNYHGLRVHRNSKVSARNTVASGNTANGFLVSTPSNTSLNLQDCEASNNAIGVHSDGGTSIIRMSHTIVSGNSSAGLSSTNSGQIISFGNNSNSGNAVDGSPTSTILPQ